jgi:CheY-like chemotaxis protein
MTNFRDNMSRRSEAKPRYFNTRRRSMSSLRGARVFVVEDEAMLLLNLETMLVDLGCVVAGTADKLDDALQIARTSDFDVALLDVNLGGKRVDPVADAIRARGTPIVFVTGYGKMAASGLVLEKPYDAAALERILHEALGTTRQ